MDTKDFNYIWVGDLRSEYPAINSLYQGIENGSITNGGICWAVATCNAVAYLTNREPTQIVTNTLSFGQVDPNSWNIKRGRLSQSVKFGYLYPEEAARELDDLFLTEYYGLKATVVSSKEIGYTQALKELSEALESTGAIVMDLIIKDVDYKPRYLTSIGYHSVCIIKDAQGTYFLVDPDSYYPHELTKEQLKDLFEGKYIFSGPIKFRINRANLGVYFKKTGKQLT